MKFDYRELLMKYIAHVGEAEGVIFLSQFHQRDLLGRFTPEEIEEMRRLDDESRKYDKQ